MSNQHDPNNLFIRDPECLYRIEGYPHHLFWTGHIVDGKQLLVVVFFPHFLVIFFNEEGIFLGDEKNLLSPLTVAAAKQFGIGEVFRRGDDRIMSSRLHSLQFCEGPISVRRFFLPQYNIGIIDFPELFKEMLMDSPGYSQDEVQVAQSELVRWFREGLFELWLNKAKCLWILGDGQIESS